MDVKSIGTAIGSFYNDMGEWPVWRSRADMTGVGSNGTALTAWSVLKFGTITSTGALGASARDAGVGTTAWTLAGADQMSGARQLWTNDPNDSGTSTVLDYLTNAEDATAKFAWRGPYLEQVRSDPWGNNYLVNVIQLWPVSETNNDACFVLCAGPNKTLETEYGQVGPTLAVGGDDIVFRIK